MNNNSYLTIGLTGPTGAGKSTLTPVFERFGCRVLDCDRLARQITLPGQPALSELARRFGGDIINPDGTLNRALLAARAFADPRSRDDLDAITHPRITGLLLEHINEAHDIGLHAVIDAPLLFEAGLEKICDTTIAVLAPLEIRLHRIMQRDGIDEQTAMLRINAQHGDDYYIQHAHHTLTGGDTRSEFLLRAEELIRRLLG